MSERKTWQGIAEPIGRMWHITVNGLDGATQARSAREIEAMTRDFIAGHTSAEAGSIAINISIQLPKKVRAIIDRAEKLRTESDDKRREAATETQRAAKELKAEGLTVRDIGAALGVSHQRAHQLIKG